MQGLMQDWPMTLDRVITHARTVCPNREIVTRSVEGPIVRTTYTDLWTRSRQVSRALLEGGVTLGLGGGELGPRALDVLTIDPQTGEFRRERYPLSDEAFTAANEAVASSSVGRGCSGDSGAVARRNETLMTFAQGDPSQRLIWRCEARN